MPDFILHHVSILTSDVERSAAFYRDVFGFERLPRPDFPVRGAWLGCGDRQVHLVDHAPGTFRKGGVDNNDTHFAIRTANFDAVVDRLKALGFREDLPADDPLHLMVKRTGAAGFAQVYFLDPDRNVIEVNNAPM
jgi:catechol 2,3-dioxygenase-like lactoylglutathione lyase family enzyme